MTCGKTGWRAAAPMLVAFAAAGANAAMAQNGNPFAAVATPAPGPARVLGSYANGCIQGAEALAADGPGWHVLRPARNRNWGHPSLVGAVRKIAASARAETGKAMLVADLGQPRGGFATGHASHQAGLDADIRLALWPVGKTLDEAARADPPTLSMLDEAQKEIDRSRWGADQAALLRAAARLPEVDRIFVHPVIKRELCATAGADRAWLRKIVPWYGHHYHMHVRVRCPADSPACAPSPPVPEGDGCGGALAWWFTAEPYRNQIGRRPPKPVVPSACWALVKS